MLSAIPAFPQHHCNIAEADVVASSDLQLERMTSGTGP